MPLVWPVLTEAERAAVPLESSFFTQDRVFLLIAAAAAIAALICYAIAKLLAFQPFGSGRADRRAATRGPVIQDNRLPLALGDVRNLARPPGAVNASTVMQRDRIPGINAVGQADRQRWQRKTA